MSDLKIDPEFRDKIPPMTEAEFKTLEENILKDGRVLVPIITWNGIIVDGHNRYRIIQKHPNIPFDVVEREFADRYEAIVWICRNQLGRRNLTDEQKTYLIGKQYEAQKKTRGGDRKSKCQIGTLKTEENAKVEIAREHGLGERTVIRAEKFAKGIDTADRVSPGFKEKALSGEIKVTKAIIQEIPKMKEEEQKKTIRAIESGGKFEKGTLSQLFQKSVSTNYESAEYTEENLREELESLVQDFVKKFKNTLTSRSSLLSDSAGKKAVLTCLDMSEKEIKKVRELLNG